MSNTDICRILIVSSIDISLIRFRGKLLSDLVTQGMRVFVAAPEFSDECRLKLIELGTTPKEIALNPTGMSVIEDARAIQQLYRLIKREKIDLVFPYTMKPVMYTSFAARLARVPAVGMVSGLGYVFVGHSLKKRLLRQLVTRVIRFSIAKNKAMVFQNTDDAAEFQEKELIANGCDVAVVSGSGVDLEEFGWRQPRGETQRIKFVFVARLLENKGTVLFLNAAKTLKGKWPKAEFHIAGLHFPDTPNAVDLETIKEFSEKGFIRYHGEVTDIPELLREMDVIVFPSWYREGVPRALLEALSVGLAVITTDMPGCKETVDHDVNGWLIRPKSQQSLDNAITAALKSPEKLIRMSHESRNLAVERFDVNKVNAELVRLLLDASSAA